jgi:hypothetical protein
VISDDDDDDDVMEAACVMFNFCIVDMPRRERAGNI